jgi:hypothetical protein
VKTPENTGLRIALLALAVPLVIRRDRAALSSALPLAPFLAAGSLLALLR